MALPLVSILLPVFNGEKYLEECLKSIALQTYTNWELVIVNDGSIDRSDEIIVAFIKLSKNHVVYINLVHKGLPACLNIGVKQTKGKYIARMDADDIMLPERLEMQFTFMENNPKIGLLGSNVTEIDKNGNKLRVAKFPLKDNEIKRKMLKGSSISHPTVFVRREIFVENPYEEIYPSPEDYELWVRLLDKINFENLPEALIMKRIHSDQITQKKYRSMMYQKMMILTKYIFEKKAFVGIIILPKDLILYLLPMFIIRRLRKVTLYLRSE